jgi:hypothetical protein
MLTGLSTGGSPRTKKRQRASGESALFLIDAMSGTTQDVMENLRGVSIGSEGCLSYSNPAADQFDLTKIRK